MHSRHRHFRGRLRLPPLVPRTLVLVLVLAACKESTGPGSPVGTRWALDVAAGGSHTCALAADSTTYCWGSGFGIRPTSVSDSLRFASIAAGSGQTCAVTASGNLYCWGATPLHSDWGETPQLLDPTRVYRVVAVGPAGGDACGLVEDGTAYCWGVNEFGEVGDGTGLPQSAPTEVRTDKLFKEIGAGEYFACGLALGGSVFCWGQDGEGQLGDGYHETRAVPGHINDLSSFSFVAVGYAHACALLGGDAYCWGDNYDGEVGDGTSGDVRQVPVRAAKGIEFASLALGDSYSCGLTPDGTAYCWGANSFGQLGDGTYEGRTTPVAVQTSMRFSALTAGEAHTCGRTLEGSVYCWGDNSAGQVGDGSGTESWPIPVLVRW